jgi:hypothetical protein
MARPGLVRAAVLGVVAIAGVTTYVVTRAQAPARSVVHGIDWAGRGVWLRAELHTHTRFSDGGHTVEEVVNAAARNRCDVVAITDHADAGLKAATPEYVSAIEAARASNPAITVITGVEWNVPPGKGQEHATVLFPTGMEKLDTLATFKDQFDDYKKEGENPELALAALAWLQPKDRAALAPVVMMNHPTRAPNSTSAPLITFEALRRAAPGVLVGVEGGPGHQRSTPLGSYKNPTSLVNRWDPIVAEVGGAWDTWLGRGLDVWGAAADADFHHESGDFWPCEFSSTWIYAPDKTVNGVIRALHAGSYFGEQGHIAEKVELRVKADDQARPVVPGQRLIARTGAPLTVTLALDVPATDYQQKPNRIDTVELIGIVGQKATLLFSGAPNGPEAFSVPVTVPPGGIVLRARGRRGADGESALMFYTNPIRISTAAR